MKIAIIGTAHPYRGGLAAFNERLATELAREHEVTIFTFTLQYPGFLFPGKSQYTDGPAPEGLRIVRNINSVNPLSWYSAGRQIRKEGFELAVIGFWLPFMGPALGTVGRLVGCPVVSVVHNIIPHEPRPGDVAFARYYCGASDGFLSLTDSVILTALLTMPSSKSMAWPTALPSKRSSSPTMRSRTTSTPLTFWCSLTKPPPRVASPK